MIYLVTYECICIHKYAFIYTMVWVCNKELITLAIILVDETAGSITS